VFGVNYTSVFRFFLLFVLLSVTLGWKLSIPPMDAGALTRNTELKIIEFLTRHSFSVASTGHEIIEGAPVIQATAGLCRMSVVRLTSEGSMRDLVHKYETQNESMFIVFDGHVYREQPTWLTVFDNLWFTFKRQLGLNAQATPPLAIVANAFCGADQLPWIELR
jgi:hypothetical protein